MELFGQKPEDAYERAKNRVLTGKPSQLGKLLIDDLCKNKKLANCCCDITVWGLFRDALPIAVRNHIAQKPFNKDTYKEIFKIADQVYESNKGTEPLPQRQVAAAQPEVAALRNQGGSRQNKNRGQQNKNQAQNQSGKNKGQGGQNVQGQSQNSQDGDKKKKLLNSESLCKIHAKWKDNANFCAAPWGCKMKNIYKEPQ